VRPISSPTVFVAIVIGRQILVRKTGETDVEMANVPSPLRISLSSPFE